MKRPNNHLHSLIHSLDRNEKGYFKKWSKIYSKNDNAFYLELFDVISLQITYDELAIKKKLLHHQNILQFHVVKNYLYKKILTCLQQYHNSQKSSSIKGLQQIEILFSKGLYEPCKKLLRELNKSNNDNITSLQLLQWEKKLTILGYNEEQSVTLQEEVSLLHHLKYKNNLEQMQLKLHLILQRTRKNQSKNIIKEVNVIKEDPSLTGDPPTNIELLMLWHETHFLSHFVLENYEKTKPHAIVLRNILQNNSNLITEPLTTINLITFLIRSARRNRDFKTVEKYIHLLNQIFDSKNKLSKYERALTWGTSEIYITDLLYHTQKLETAQEHVGKIVAILPKYIKHLDTIMLLMLHSNITVILFLNGNYKKAAQWSKITLESTNMTVRIETIIEIWLVRIISHLELENIELAELQHQLFIKFLKKQKLEKSSTLETQITTFLGGLIEGKTSWSSLQGKALMRKLHSHELEINKHKKYEYLIAITKMMEKKIL